MAGIELYAPRRPRHKRTWTAAALVLAIVFIALGQTLTAMPGLMLGLTAMDGSSVGWVGMAYTLAGFAATALLVIGWVVLFERRDLASIGFNGSGLKRFARGYGVGLAFLLSVVGLIAALGGYRVEGGGAFAAPSVIGALFPILVLMIASSSRARPKRS